MSNLLYSNENWTLKKQEKLRKTEEQMKFVRKTAKHAILDHKINQNIFKKPLKNNNFWYKSTTVTINGSVMFVECTPAFYYKISTHR
jgi:DNA-binding sugar fermentation-stimulating protein